MPPNNYIPGIFPEYNRIFTSFGKLHPSLFCPVGPLQPIGPITRFLVWLSKRLLSNAFPSGLRLRSRRTGPRRRCLGLRHSSLLFVFACGEPVFTVGASVFATLRISSSSPMANRSSPQAPRSLPEAWRKPCRCSQIARGPPVDGRRWCPQHALLLLVRPVYHTGQAGPYTGQTGWSDYDQHRSHDQIFTINL